MKVQIQRKRTLIQERGEENVQDDDGGRGLESVLLPWAREQPKDWSRSEGPGRENAKNKMSSV